MTTPERLAAPPQPIEPDDATLSAWLEETADYALRQAMATQVKPPLASTPVSLPR